MKQKKQMSAWLASVHATCIKNTLTTKKNKRHALCAATNTQATVHAIAAVNN